MVKSFWTDEEIEQGTQKVIDLDEIGPNCHECGLHRSVKSPMMKYSGEGEKQCLTIGEAPGANEDARGIQFEEHAQAGGYLRQSLRKCDLDLDRDFWKTNAVCCRPIKKGKNANRAPTSAEVSYCRPLLEQTIKETKPKFIWLLGGVAVDSFYMSAFKRKNITRWRGLCIPDQKYGAWVVPQFHPSFVIRDLRNKNLTSQYDRDIQWATEKLNLPWVKIHDYNKHVEGIKNYENLITILDNIIEMSPPLIEIDFETTGLKPFRLGHKIVSISMCCSKSHAISFPFDYQQFWDTRQFIQIKRRVRRILTHPKIKKMAHNAQFEYVWAHEILGVSDSGPWGWDSLIAAHVLDNRSGFGGLKFQTYANFGVYPYDGPVAKFIKGFPFNKMEECPLDDLLHYGGLDSLFGFMLEGPQKQQFLERGEKLFDAYKFFERGTFAMGRLELNGICTDEEYYEGLTNKTGTGDLDKRIDELIRVTAFGEEAKHFKARTGREIDLESSKDLGILLYDILKYPPVLTDKGNRSVDEKALHKINLPFTDNLLKLRKLVKVAGTYVAQFKRFSYKGKIHPSFNLTIPVTYRSSSSDPNFHNIPKRDDYSKEVTRKGIKPSPGRLLLSSDFSGIEVGISACYNKDKNLIKYITDEKTDMHRDSAADIWILPQEEVSDKIRYTGKNGWVFPQFYNDYYVNCARQMWDNYLDLETNSGVPLRKHLARKGIKDLIAFTEHCKKVEDKFWGQRFKTYKKWKDKINLEYQKKGYLETFFGFQFTGYMTRNECNNYQTQGTAFHVLLWTLLEVEQEMIRKMFVSDLVGQIHDDMITDCDPPELDEQIETINYYGTEQIKDIHKWIIIPLKIDHEVSKIDGNWAEMEKKNNA